MAETSDEAQRTEEPTPKRLEDARKRGDAPKSQEAIALAAFAAAFLALWLFVGPFGRELAAMGAAFVDHPHEFSLDAGALQRLYVAVLAGIGLASAGIGAILCAAALFAHIGQARPVPEFSRIAPTLSKISPIEGLKRIYGRRRCSISSRGSSRSSSSARFSAMRCGRIAICSRASSAPASPTSCRP